MAQLSVASLASLAPIAAPAVDVDLRASAATRARSVAIWCEEPGSAAAWCDALAEEGLAVRTIALDDAWPHKLRQLPIPDARVLHLTRGLPPQLARLRELRADAPTAPLVVACRGLRDLDHVLALEMGADDAVDSGLAASVVAARLRALWRRDARVGLDAPAVQELRFGALELSQRERRVRLAGAIVPLTEGEFEVLWLLASHAGQALSRRDILRRVRGLDDHPMDRSIDSRVYRIRAKLGDNELATQRIRTVRNRGYVFSPVGW